MRLWHEALLPFLPRQQLLGQHRECCALRGKGWGRKHSTVDYVFKYRYERLVAYHYEVISEMLNRGFTCNPSWINPEYRGTNSQRQVVDEYFIRKALETRPVYPEHDDKYLKECLDNLKGKGVYIDKRVYRI